MVQGDKEDGFRVFVTDVEPRLRRALTATYGYERGREATAEALAYAWEHWDRVAGLANPAGYLYRVGQSRTRHKKVPIVFGTSSFDEPLAEPQLASAISDLPEAAEGLRRPVVWVRMDLHRDCRDPRSW